MRYVTIPSPISIIADADVYELRPSPSNPEGVLARKKGDVLATHTLQTMLNDVWLNNADVFGKNMTGIRAACRIEALFRDKAPGDEVAMDESDWKMLNDSVENSAIQPLWIARKCVSIAESIQEAKSQNK